MSGKGDTPRPGDSQRYREEYDRIFRKPERAFAPQHMTWHEAKGPAPPVIEGCYFWEYKLPND